MATEGEIRAHIRELIEGSHEGRDISEEETEISVWKAFALRVQLQSRPEVLSKVFICGKIETGKMDTIQPEDQ